MDVISAVAALVCCTPAHLDEPAASALLTDVARVRGWLDGVEARLGDRLDELRAAAATGPPGDGPPAGTLVPATRGAASADEQIAAAQRSSTRHAQRVRRRGKLLGQLPQLAAVLDRGDASGEHVDAVHGALSGLPVAQRRRVTEAHGGEIAELARGAGPDELAREVRRLGDAIAREDGVSRRTTQRRDTRLRVWTDRASQMVHLHGRYDPATGIRLSQRLDRAVDRLFRAAVPEDCPDEPGERQDFLRAHALVLLTQGGQPGVDALGAASQVARDAARRAGRRAGGGAGGGGGSGGSGSGGGGEIVVIVDERTLLDGAEHEHTHLDVPGDVDPHEISVDDVRSWVDEPDAVVVPAVLDADGVVTRLGRPVPARDAFEREPDGPHIWGRATADSGVNCPGAAEARVAGPTATDADTRGPAPPRWRWRAAALRSSLAHPQRLDRGRTRRVAGHAQRVALRVMYPTCGVPGCTVRFEHTTPHHVRWFGRHRGRTDLRNLFPLCHRHHHDVHDRGWRIVLPGDRRVTIRRPGAPALRGGPPAASHRELVARRRRWRQGTSASLAIGGVA